MKKIIVFIFIFLVFPSFSLAATTSISGNKTVAEGGSGSASFYVNGAGATIGSVDGNFSSSNTSCIQITSVTGAVAAANTNLLGSGAWKLAYLDMSGVGFTNSKLATVNYKAVGSGCSASITFTSIEIANIDAVEVSGSNSSLGISVLSNANNLTSLSVSSGGISFSSGTTSYSTTVESNVTSVVINGTAVAGASVSGTGTKSLNYGSNKFNIVVTAQSGAKKTYTVNITRKDNRSSDTSLKSLTVNSGTLEPGFSSGVYNYKLIVPFEVTNLDVNAQTNDSKSKVSVSGNSDFISEETKNVVVRVTAENGSTADYIIAVTRGKDPNKPLLSDNNLTSLIPSVGVLSPVFNNEVTEYLLWLPYEVDNVTFTYTTSDTKYATVKENKPELLQVGSNVYEYVVTAEDLSTKTYKVTVMRGYSLEALEPKSSLLSSLNLVNGTLKSEFNSETYYYEYDSKEELNVEAIAAESDSSVIIKNTNGVVTISVTSSTGENSIYILIPYKSDLLWIILTISLPLLVLGTVILFKIKKIKSKEKKLKDKKQKKIESKEKK